MIRTVPTSSIGQGGIQESSKTPYLGYVRTFLQTIKSIPKTARKQTNPVTATALLDYCQPLVGSSLSIDLGVVVANGVYAMITITTPSQP